MECDDMKVFQGSRILPFVVVTIGSLFLFFYTFRVMIGRYAFDDTFMRMFLFNIPIALLDCGCNFFIANFHYKNKEYDSSVRRVIVDLVMTTCLTGMIVALISNSFHWLHSYSLFHVILPSILWNFQLFLFITVYLHNQRNLLAQREIAWLQEENTRYQFEALKYRLNPHFLFNSLNVLAGLTYQDAEKANRFTKRLSEVYRYLLSIEGKETVSLAEEYAFVEDYLYLVRLRYEEGLQVETEISNSVDWQAKVVPCGIQLLVENALKHNVCNRRNPLHVRIFMGNAEIVVENSLRLRAIVDKSRFGLRLLRERYARYGLDLYVESTEESFRVRLPFIICEGNKEISHSKY